MCFPRPSIFVTDRGEIIAKPGVLSHVELLEQSRQVTAERRFRDLFPFEYDLEKRLLEPPDYRFLEMEDSPAMKLWNYVGNGATRVADDYFRREVGSPLLIPRWFSFNAILMRPESAIEFLAYWGKLLGIPASDTINRAYLEHNPVRSVVDEFESMSASTNVFVREIRSGVAKVPLLIQGYVKRWSDSKNRIEIWRK